MIIPCFAFKSLQEYVESPSPAHLERPSHCELCGPAGQFWKHGTFERTVVQDGDEKVVKIQRFLCRYCGRTVSLLFSFLVAYRKHSASTVAEGIERYSDTETTYRETSIELSSLDSEDCPPSPSHSTVFRWVKDVAARVPSLVAQVQKELLLRGLIEQLSRAKTVLCPNSAKAKSKEKHHQLDCLAEGNELGSVLVNKRAGVTEALHAVFLHNVETIQMFLCHHLLKLSAPQNMRHGLSRFL